MFWFGFNKNLKYILPSAFSINYSIHLYFKGNSVHMFLIHLALTHQNIVSSNAIFCPKGFSSHLLLFYFLETKRYSFPKANPSKLPESLLNIACRTLWVWKSSVNLSWSLSPLSATLWLPCLFLSFDQGGFAHTDPLQIRDFCHQGPQACRHLNPLIKPLPLNKNCPRLGPVRKRICTAFPNTLMGSVASPKNRYIKKIWP